MAKTKTPAKAQKKKTSPPAKRAEARPKPLLFPVVGIGASAGGVEALRDFFENIPQEPGIAFVVVQHLDPTHASMLTELLSRATSLEVVEVKGKTKIEPDHVYVIAPATTLAINDGTLEPSDATARRFAPSVDLFFRSLAEDRKDLAVGVILSGSASDGTAGCKAIKAEGGITFAQDSSAKYEGMPSSAIASGAIDFVLPPNEIALEVVRLAQRAFLSGSMTAAFDQQALSKSEELRKIFSMLQLSYDVDFTHYKPSTVGRRIQRRMTMHKIDDLKRYVDFIRENPGELEQLYEDILIRVTGFFRDPEVFEALQKEVFRILLDDRNRDQPIRIWVPGCATGEEVYSLAMALLESAGPNTPVPLQIFGTDVSEQAIDRARSGVFDEASLGDMSPERIHRFFVKVDGQYRIAKSVRDCCIFARQNLTKDPPFSKLDLISCRNVLIYLGSVLQRKVMTIFHYALKPNGFLVLGSSETIGAFGDLFSVADRRQKIYAKKSAIARVPIEFSPVQQRERPARGASEEESAHSGGNIVREADRLVLARYAPSGVLVNEELQIVQFRGRTSAFLEPAPGAASFDLFKMAKEGLLADLRAAVHKAKKSELPTRRDRVRVGREPSTIIVNLEVMPMVVNNERFFLVLFEEAQLPQEEPSRSKKRGEPADDPRQVARLKKELEATREYLQSIIEEQEAMNEELRSANEEIQSSNEELQSTNEELETAKEELQSSNEELTTLNEELENRNSELALLNNDLVNLLASVDIPIVMLGSDLRIRRLNPAASKTLNLIASDVGRSINDLKLTLDLDDLDETVATVLDTLTMSERQVKDRRGRWFSLKVRPYKTTENKIDGAVLTLVDIDHLRGPDETPT